MILKYPNLRTLTWKKSRSKKKSPGEASLDILIPMKPLIVNLNKLSSHDKDRFLCLAMDLSIDGSAYTNADDNADDKELPKIHPSAWDATIIFLSSLTYKEVKTFDSMKIVKEQLTDIINPYMNDMLYDVDVSHVIGLSPNRAEVDHADIL